MTRIALCQTPVDDGDAEANLERAVALLSEETQQSDVVLLPELWTSGYAHDSWPRIAREFTPRVCDRLAEMSRRNTAWIGGSMVSLADDGALVNRFWMFSPTGEVHSYDKAHLFPPMREDQYLRAGYDRTCVQVAGISAGLSICFDLRFPELYRADAVAGVVLFLVVAAWPYERLNTMTLLTRARAAENQAFAAICNRTGTADDGTFFGGGSLLAGPFGDVVVAGGTNEEVLRADIDLEEAMRARHEFPVFSMANLAVDRVQPPPRSNS